ncbi:helix-turn-helix transcriptional regulator [Paenibacillus aestuarii]|uniref:Helix-turn-helix transcriptional regulator n=1 Tax=Paenibacillus aestuarii TaxID=516965 RepID=A0ABW0KDV5_9BACL|nr:helix-turn-helix transcriptional regulator [Paenibacillus aestuarii]
MEEDHFRKTIGEFLKTRRSSLSPSQFGLPEGHTRRRTPGLRREEVAQLADVSTTWYTWLEQGRKVSASSEVLKRLAEALQLTIAEREYLYLLAGKYISPLRDLSEFQVTPAFMHLVTATPYPFLAIGPENRLIAWNAAACTILTDFSLLLPEEMQVLWLLFMHPAFRTKIINWEQSTKATLSFFRKIYDRFADQPWYSELVEALMKRSEEFAKWWPLHEVASKNRLQLEIVHPTMGILYFEILTFTQMNDLENLMCCIYMPVPGTQTAERLAEWHQVNSTDTRI